MNVPEYQTLKYIVNLLVGTYVPVTTGEGIGTCDFAFITGCILLVLIINFMCRCIYKLIFRN